MSLVEDSLESFDFYNNSVDLFIKFKEGILCFSYFQRDDPEQSYKWSVDADGLDYLNDIDLSYMKDVLEELNSEFKVDLTDKKIYRMKLDSL